MEVLSTLRNMFASLHIFIAEWISKIYSLILMIADVNVVNETVRAVIERIYGIIGLFMLFKLALVIINYVINPDKEKSVGKILTRIVVSLVLIPTMPEIFNKVYELQGIILKENIIGNIILGDGAGNLKQESESMEEIGNQVAYLVFSNFLDYNDTGDLSFVFSDCPNIFIEPDDATTLKEFEYCCTFENGCPSVPMCGYYLYYPRYDDPIGLDDVTGDVIYPDSRNNYYTCKSGDDTSTTINKNWTMLCGIRDGEYVYDLINEGRGNYSVKTILSSEIVTAIESDPFFLDTGNACNPKSATDSGGDFVFEYNFLPATLVSLVVIFLLIVMCVDIAIRAVKLSFLEVISPIPIISYIDVDSSKLFGSWLKETVSTFLQLFIRLAVIFFSILLFKWLLSVSASNDFIINVFLIIGILLFSFQMPKLLCNLFNLGKENGFMSLIKNTAKFAVGAAAIGASTIGGAASGAAHIKENVGNAKNSVNVAKDSLKNFKTNFRNANGVMDKLGVIGQTSKNLRNVPRDFLRVPGDVISSGVGSGIRTAKKLAGNKGNYRTGDVSASIHEDVLARAKKRSDFNDMDESEIKSEISSLESRKQILENSYTQSNNFIAAKLANESNASDIKKAFESGDSYVDYADYVDKMNFSGNTSSIIDENKFNEYNPLYSSMNEQGKELDEIDDRIEMLNDYVEKK